MQPSWKTAQGKVMHTSEMDDNHAQNALNRLIRERGVMDILTIIADALQEKHKKQLAKSSKGNIEDCFMEEELRKAVIEAEEEGWSIYLNQMGQSCTHSDY